jgi:CTP:molybdopterin cytidylyltransferase MocA
MSVAGLVLAAGSGTRFGGPKALAVTGERTWLEIVITTLLEGGCRPVVVVLGASAAAAHAAVRIDRLPTNTGNGAPAVLWVVNDAWANGRAGSLQCGLRAVPPEATGVVIHAVDHPDVRPETVAALVAAQAGSNSSAPTTSDIPIDSGIPTDSGVGTDSGNLPDSAGPTHVPREPMGESVFLPVHRGRRGHPVLLARTVWREVLALGPDDSLRTVVHRDPERLRDVEVDDPGIHRNRNERDSEEITPTAQPQRGER